MAKKSKNLGYGLNLVSPDERNYKLGSVFGIPLLSDIPKEDFLIADPEVSNQGNTDACTGYSSAMLSGIQENLPLSPKYQFAQIKKKLNDLNGFGADLGTACKSLVDPGSLELKFELPLATRDEFANWNNWPSNLDELAKAHRKKTYFELEAHPDIFDSIRANLWKFREEKRAILTGALWRPEWTASGGVIPKKYGNSGFGHAFIFIGQKFINGEPHLVAHLSNGTVIGDKGRFYFSREIVNKECSYGNFMVQDIDRECAEYMIETGRTVEDVGLVKKLLLVKKVLQFIFKW